MQGAVHAQKARRLVCHASLQCVKCPSSPDSVYLANSWIILARDYLTFCMYATDRRAISFSSLDSSSRLHMAGVSCLGNRFQKLAINANNLGLVAVDVGRLPL